MKLKKIEIKGFKSFADKTIIHFNENITGIVGPNGCGKSNVVDSIRWVLGEQKISQLRLEKMDNVLFNGTKSRKATSLAEVSLTFDNTKNLISTDFHEVTITRKLFRTGESDYRINDVSCRLKDIQNLFVDSGIGSDSYAIIELGMVDEILQNKDNSRKKLFEQASSISKYKIRKKESLLKLKSTEENLERLEDVLAEIESNLKTLEVQAKRAERFIQIKNEYKNLSLEFFKIKVSQYKSDYNNIYHKKTIEANKLTELDVEIAKSEAEQQKVKLIQLEKESNLTKIQKQFNQIISGLGTNENERNLLKEQIANLDIQSKQVNTQIENLENEKIKLQKSIADINLEIKNLDISYKKQLSLVENSQANLQKLEIKFLQSKNIIEKDKLEFNTLQKEVFELDKSQSLLKANQNELALLLEKNAEELITLNQSKNKNETNYNNNEKERLSYDIKYKTIQEIESKNTQQILDLEAVVVTQKTSINQLQRKLDSKKNEYNLLKSMIENLEGYPESIKFLKKNVALYENKPLFSDLVNCADEYKIAIENVLSPYANFFLVDKMEEAIQTIAKLKEQNIGKANFFILDIMDQLPLAPFKIIPEFISILEVIEINSKYKNLIHFLFHHIYISKDINSIDFSHYKNEKIKIIDIDGTLIFENGIVSGGASNLFDGSLVGRNKNLEQLLMAIQKDEKELSKFEKILFKTLNEIETLKKNSKLDALNELTKQIDQCSKNQLILKFTLDQSIEKIATISHNTTDAENKLKKLQLDLIDVSKTLELKKKELSLITNNNSTHENEYQEFNESYNKEKIAVNNLIAASKNTQYLMDQQQKQVEFYEQKIKEIENQLNSNTNTIAAFNDNATKKKFQLKSIEENILADYTNKKELDDLIQMSEKEYYTSKNSLAQSELNLKEKNQNRMQLLDVIKLIDDKLQEMKVELMSIKERLSIEFNIELDEFINTDLSTEMKMDELIQKINFNKKKIETYGEINSMAIETYKEMKERFDFLVDQKKDIIQSKENLLNTIKEIDHTAKDRFLNSFELIRSNFIKTFRILFTEDDECDLILLDASNPLESEIEIIAKPKGKKPLTINQLSGGEKTLTATALLFSLYLLKPAPFCIFDEVDAPLDDTNIAKFNRIIEEYSHNSQFIIVTHNKQTMANVDILYGVTMIEKGISKLVPVDFRTLLQSS